MGKENDTDILRAEDIIPPFKEKRNREQKQPSKTEAVSSVKKADKIPKFDLAKQIMVEQRKNVSIQRKGPGTKSQASQLNQKAQAIEYNVKPQAILSQQEKIIAEIVARDIRKLRSNIIKNSKKNEQ